MRAAATPRNHTPTLLPPARAHILPPEVRTQLRPPPSTHRNRFRPSVVPTPLLIHLSAPHHLLATTPATLPAPMPFDFPLEPKGAACRLSPLSSPTHAWCPKTATSPRTLLDRNTAPNFLPSSRLPLDPARLTCGEAVTNRLRYRQRLWRGKPSLPSGWKMKPRWRLSLRSCLRRRRR